MATYKVHKTKDFTVMSNTHLRDKNLSLKAKGLLSVMLSLPEEWDYSINGLVAICKENKTAVENTLKELKEFRYLVVTRLTPDKTKSGRMEYEYDIFETPQEKKQEGKKQGVENLGVENLGVDILGVENQLQLNTNILNTKELNKDKLNTEVYKDIVDYLNEKAKTQYRHTTPKTKNHINARINEGFTVEDFKKVIDYKVTEWMGTDMEQYLRPETLFGTKFESYLNAPSVKHKDGDPVQDDAKAELYKRIKEKYTV